MVQPCPHFVCDGIAMSTYFVCDGTAMSTLCVWWYSHVHILCVWWYSHVYTLCVWWCSHVHTLCVMVQPCAHTLCVMVQPCLHTLCVMVQPCPHFVCDGTAMSTLSVWWYRHVHTLSVQTGLLGKKASWTNRTDTPLTPMKRSSSKPSRRKKKKKWKQQHLNFYQPDSFHKQAWAGHSVQAENWAKQTQLPICTASARLASLRCAHATQTSWL